LVRRETARPEISSPASRRLLFWTHLGGIIVDHRAGRRDFPFIRWPHMTLSDKVKSQFIHGIKFAGSPTMGVANWRCWDHLLLGFYARVAFGS